MNWCCAMQNAAYDKEIPATGLTRDSPGLKPTTVVRLAEQCAKWVDECYKSFDEKVSFCLQVFVNITSWCFHGCWSSSCEVDK